MLFFFRADTKSTHSHLYVHTFFPAQNIYVVELLKNVREEREIMRSGFISSIGNLFWLLNFGICDLISQLKVKTFEAI